MSALLKKLESKVGKVNQERESSDMTAMMDDIRDGIESLHESAKQDSSRDDRTSSLEKLVIRLYDALEKLEENRKAEDAIETTAKQQECARLEPELAASKLKCEQAEQQLASAQSARLDDARILREVSATLAKYEAMYEAEKRARIVAEQALSDAKIQHEKHMEMMCGAEEKSDVEFSGWDITPVRDTADKALRYELTPKKN